MVGDLARGSLPIECETKQRLLTLIEARIDELKENQLIEKLDFLISQKIGSREHRARPQKPADTTSRRV
jgi:uncharacterized protein YqgQ